MPNFIINPQAISWDSIKNELMGYIQSKTEDETWKDFYASSAGQTVVELAAGLGAFYAYHFIMGRRESFLTTAQNYSSIVSLAQNDGYSVSRGSNLKVNINFVPEVTAPIYKWDIIGTYTEYDIICMKTFEGDEELKEGVPVEIPCIIGNLMNGDDAITIDTDKLTQFTFHCSNVSDDIRLILNDEEMPVSTQFKDLMNDYWVTLTNAFGAFDAYYLNTLEEGTHKYKPNDVLRVQFVETNNLTWNNFDKTSINMYIPGRLASTGVTLLTDKLAAEDKEVVRIKAPVNHELSMVIRSRKDYSKYLLLANPKLISANDHDVTPGLIEITYLAGDGSIMSPQEKEQWLDAIEEARPSGVARATIVEPVRVEKNINIKLWKLDSESTMNLDANLDAIIEKHNNVLGDTLDLSLLEHDIEDLSGIKIARVSIDSEPWQSKHQYKLLDTIVTSSGATFYCSEFRYRTGSIEPQWPTEDGGTVIDNEILWEKVKDYEGTELHTWKSNETYNLYDYIRRDVMSDGKTAASGLYEPVWGPETVTDNHIVWHREKQGQTGSEIENEPVSDIWVPNRMYSIGDKIKVVLGSTTYIYSVQSCYVYEDTYIYTVSGFIGRSGNVSAVWGDEIVYDNNIIWKKFGNGVIPEPYTQWRRSTPYKIGDCIKAGTYYYMMNSIIGTSQQNEPSWTVADGSQTIDNDIVWTKMSDDNRVVTLKWNEYFKLSRK